MHVVRFTMLATSLALGCVSTVSSAPSDAMDDENNDGAARPVDPAQPAGEGAGRDAQPANDNPEARATSTKRRVA